MPSDSLLMIATLIGMSLIAQVASSWLVIWKQPSPSIAQTVRLGAADLRAHRGRHGEPHGAEATGVDPGAGLLEVDVVRGPHLVLTHARAVDGVRAGDRAEPLEDVLRREAAVGRLVVGDRVALLDADDVVDPLLVVAGATGRRLGTQQRR